MKFAGAHLLSIDQLQRGDVARVFEVADTMEPYALRQKRNHVLDGAILGSMFFEPSTRTRVSFGCAFNLLGGHVRETTGFEHSAIAKGESLYDTARVISGYSDVIVMRHPEAGSVRTFASTSRVPVINGGDGSNEHPTQALLDIYTISRELRRSDAGRDIDGLRIALIGDLKYGRTVHSLCRLLCLYKNVRVALISPKSLAAPEDIVSRLRECGCRVVASENMEEHIRDVDIIYATRVQKERFEDPEEARRYQHLYQVNRRIYTRNCRPNTVIMHPLPRDSRDGDVDEDLNEHPNLAIFRQADNGILVRMALFALIFDVADSLSRYDSKVHWHSLRGEKPL